MKKIITAVIAAACMTFASCQKMDSANKSSEPEKTVRVIKGEFSNDGTKTTLGDNDQPLWSEGDVIRVLDGSSYQDITLAAGNIKEDGKKIEFSTTLTGAMLYAVYPASATAMTSCSDGNITFIIPAVQDGTFGSANICVASGDGSTANSIYFSNATAVVEMAVGTDEEGGKVVGTKFEAANNIAGSMTVTMESKGKISTTTPSLSSKTISVSGTQAPEEDKFYLAVAPGATGAVTITCNTLKKYGLAYRSSKTLAMNKIYEMNLSSMTIDADIDLTGQKGVQNGQEFVLIKAKYDGTNYSYLKWATQNLAVTTSGRAQWQNTNYQIGDYFQWAASYEGYGLDGTTGKEQVDTNLVIYTSFTNTCAGGSSNSFTFKTGKETTGFTKDSNAPYCDGTYYTKYTGTGDGKDGKTVLEPSDDVASIVLGGTWRMPTGGGAGELKAMKAVTYWVWDATDKGYYVFKPGVGTNGSAGGRGTLGQNDDKTKSLLFFPAAGDGYLATLYGAGSIGRYCSSTLRSDNTDNAYSLGFDPSNLNPEYGLNRCYGFSVRPVSD